MSRGSSTAGNLRDLEAELRLLSGQVRQLRESITLLEAAPSLKPDAAARLAMYLRHEERLAMKVESLEWQLEEQIRHREPHGDAASSHQLADDLLRQLGLKGRASEPNA